MTTTDKMAPVDSAIETDTRFLFAFEFVFGCEFECRFEEEELFEIGVLVFWSRRELDLRAKKIINLIRKINK